MTAQRQSANRHSIFGDSRVAAAMGSGVSTLNQSTQTEPVSMESLKHSLGSDQEEESSLASSSMESSMDAAAGREEQAEEQDDVVTRLLTCNQNLTQSLQRAHEDLEEMNRKTRIRDRLYRLSWTINERPPLCLDLDWVAFDVDLAVFDSTGSSDPVCSMSFVLPAAICMTLLDLKHALAAAADEIEERHALRPAITSGREECTLMPTELHLEYEAGQRIINLRAGEASSPEDHYDSWLAGHVMSNTKDIYGVEVQYKLE